MWVQKHTQMPGKGRTETNVVGAPFYPAFMAKSGAYFLFTFAVLAVLGDLRPDQPDLAVRPLHPGGHLGRLPARLLHGLPRGRAAASCPPGRSTSSGYTLPLSVLIPALVPLGHHHDRRWRSTRSSNSGSPGTTASTTSPTGRATTRTAPRSASPPSPSTASCGCSGANDEISAHFHISLFAMTWFGRIAIFVGPVHRLLHHLPDLHRPAAQGRRGAGARRGVRRDHAVAATASTSRSTSRRPRTSRRTSAARSRSRCCRRPRPTARASRPRGCAARSAGSAPGSAAPTADRPRAAARQGRGARRRRARRGRAPARERKELPLTASRSERASGRPAQVRSARDVETLRPGRTAC